MREGGWREFHHHASLSIAAYGLLIAQRLKTGGDPNGKDSVARQVPAVPEGYIHGAVQRKQRHVTDSITTLRLQLSASFASVQGQGHCLHRT